MFLRLFFFFFFFEEEDDSPETLATGNAGVSGRLSSSESSEDNLGVLYAIGSSSLFLRRIMYH